MKAKIVVVDDERLKRATLEAQLKQAGYEVAAFDNPFPALAWIDQNGCDVVITDLRMPSMDGVAFMHELRKLDPSVAVVMMTAYGSIETAVQALKQGAFDYLCKPFDFEELAARLERILELRRLREEVARSQGASQQGGYFGIVSRSPQMRRIIEMVQSVADNPCSILIRGETGTGKGVLAQAIHKAGPRRGRPFVKLGCAQLSRDILESELLGHEAGAFTGATRQKRGRFELADGGTIFLDDVDDIPLDLQVKLLHVLEDRTFERVGGEKKIGVDVRVVSATKKDLAQLFREGGFREDLYYRLKVVEVSLPPLRERKEDILPLAAHFLKLHGLRAGKPVSEICAEAANFLERYGWPGNVRELEHAMERAIAVGRGPAVQPNDLPEEVTRSGAEDPVVSLNLAVRESVDLDRILTQVESEIVQWALTKSGGNQSRAADILGVPRTTLRDRMDRLADGRLRPPAVSPQ